jgi:glycine oxidase
MRVLVIGQGLAGTLFSHAALEKGWDCHVIDAGYASASAVAAGMFNPMSFRRVVEVWDAERHLSSMKATYSALSDQLGEQLIHFLPIHKRLSNSDYAALWNRQATTLKWIEPVTYQQGTANEGIVHGGGWVNLPRLLHLWRAQLSLQNRFERRALSHRDIDNLNNGAWDAFVDCRGMHLRNAPETPRMDLRGNRGEILTLASQDAPALPSSYILNFGKWTLPIGPNQWRLGASYEWKRQDIEPNPETADFLLHALKNAVPHSASLRVQSHEVGVRPVSKDRRPMVGPCPERPKWHIFNGLGTRGVLIGPKWANLLVDIVIGDAQTPDIVNPKRLVFPV